MSERGSFVTEYIYCDRCFAAAWSVLGGHTKELMATRVPAWGETGTVFYVANPNIVRSLSFMEA